MKLKATSLFAAITLVFATIYVACKKEENSNNKQPVAVLEVTPSSGTTTTIFTYDASQSHDGNNNNSDLLYRFDFNNDNTWDLDWTYENKFDHFYPQEGNYTAVLEVKTTNDMVASDKKTVTVDKEPNNLPVISTYPTLDISHHHATFNGEVLHKGGAEVTKKGFHFKYAGAWLDRTVDSEYDTFSYTITNLVKDTIYYVKAFAANSYGVSFGEVLSFKTDGRAYGEPCEGLETITDLRDGSVYGTVQMGDQCWLNRNMVVDIGTNSCYDNNPDNCFEYGRLYDWETAIYACPEGFRLPTRYEVDWLRQEVADADELKSTQGWYGENNGTNSSAFNAKPGGFQLDIDDHTNLTTRSTFWTGDEAVSGIWFALINYDDVLMDRDYTKNSWHNPAMSVRCIKDE